MFTYIRIKRHNKKVAWPILSLQWSNYMLSNFPSIYTWLYINEYWWTTWYRTLFLLTNTVLFAENSSMHYWKLRFFYVNSTFTVGSATHVYDESLDRYSVLCSMHNTQQTYSATHVLRIFGFLYSVLCTMHNTQQT